MRKADAIRRAFLNNLKLKMVEIEERPSSVKQVSEAQIDALLSKEKQKQ